MTDVISYCLVGSRNPLYIWLPEKKMYDSNVVVTAEFERGPHTNAPSLAPKRMLEFEMGQAEWEQVNGETKFKGWKMEPPGWFARKCTEANCSWFVPMVERMAAGEEVELEEIEAAYRKHNNGKELPKGTWAELKNAGEV